MSYAIVVLHGIFAHELVMTPLARRLAKQGHDVCNLSYNSFSLDEGKLFSSIDDHFKDKENTAIVGWSLGGLLAREYLTRGSVEAKAVKKVITLGTPNKGSSIAKTIANIVPNSLHPAASKFLLEEHSAWPHKAELHAVAGSIKYSVLPPFIHDQSDRLVRVHETQLGGMCSHKVFNHDHFALIFSRDVAEHVIGILND